MAVRNNSESPRPSKQTRPLISPTIQFPLKLEISSQPFLTTRYLSGRLRLWTKKSRTTVGCATFLKIRSLQKSVQHFDLYVLVVSDAIGIVGLKGKRSAT